MAVRVHFTHPPDEFEPLSSLLDPSISVTTGPEYPPHGVDVIVTGRPGKEVPRDVKMVVVPWAGIPEGVMELGRANPDISVHNLHHNAPQVAELATALLFAVSKHIISYDAGLRQGDWRLRYQPTRATLLYGKTAVVLGYGAIGQHAAMILKGLGMRVIGVNRSGKATGVQIGDELRPISGLAETLPEADVLLIALPLTEQTRSLIDAAAIAALPDSAIIINIGRGPIIDEWALYNALKEGKLGGAGLDVWWNYPENEAARANTYPANAPLHELDNIVMSPHRAGAIIERTPVWSAALAEVLNAYARGQEVPNRVDIAAGY